MTMNHPPKKPSHPKGRFGAHSAKPSFKKRNPFRRHVHEKSCGVILYRTHQGQRDYLLLHYPGGHWDFPKGHVESIDPDEQGTALRELKEETGISEIIFTNGYREPMYYEFNRGFKERVKKVVVYFLAKTKQMEVSISFEHQNFKWLPYDQALETLTYENARALLRKAEKHLPLAEGEPTKGEPIKKSAV